MNHVSQVPVPTKTVAHLVLWPWLGVALVVGHLRLLQLLPPVCVPLIMGTITSVLLSSYARSVGFRSWVDRLDLRSVVAVHLTRFVGIYFLILYQRGELPRAFAVPGGIGDIAVAMLALIVIAAPLAPERRRRVIAFWNIVGLIDIIFVVITAARLNLANPAQMRALTYLPLSLLPLFLVPLIIATHVILFIRTRSPSVPHRSGGM